MSIQVQSLFDNTLAKITKMVREGKMSLRSLRRLDRGTEIAVMEQLLKYDHQVWKYNIMKSLALIELKKCCKYDVEWEKIYIDGTRDYQEVVYIFHDGDEKCMTEEELEWTEDEFDDDYVPVIPVKIINSYSKHYYSYLDALYILNGDDE